MYWQKMSERTSETIRQLRKKQMRKCQMRHFTYVYLFMFVSYAFILILVLFSILGKQYKMDTYKRSQQKNLDIFESIKRGTSQLELDNWHYLCIFFLQDLILQKIRSQASRLNSIGKLVSTAKCAAKITPQSKEFHINSFKNAVAHPVSQLDTVWQFWSISFHSESKRPKDQNIIVHIC